MSNSMQNLPAVEVFRTGPDWHPYPWRFAVVHEGVRHMFAGLPNQCASRQSALMRGWWRARWLKNGTYSIKYGAPA
jgi:hypothetical protein